MKFAILMCSRASIVAQTIVSFGRKNYAEISFHQNVYVQACIYIHTCNYIYRHGQNLMSYIDSAKQLRK